MGIKQRTNAAQATRAHCPQEVSATDSYHPGSVLPTPSCPARPRLIPPDSYVASEAPWPWGPEHLPVLPPFALQELVPTLVRYRLRAPVQKAGLQNQEDQRTDAQGLLWTL